jgi:hypothetical protein
MSMSSFLYDIAQVSAHWLLAFPRQPSSNYLAVRWSASYRCKLSVLCLSVGYDCRM